MRTPGSAADGSRNWAAETDISGKGELMSGPSEGRPGERSQALPSGTGNAHERGKIKTSRGIPPVGMPVVDLNGQRSGKPIQMNDPDAGRHYRCADLPEAVGVCGEPADASREVANGQAGFASASIAYCVVRDMNNTAQAWQETSCSRNEAAELRSPESEAEGLLNWAAKAWMAATSALIGTRRQAQGASLRRPRCRRRMGTMSEKMRECALWERSEFTSPFLVWGTFGGCNDPAGPWPYG